MMLKVFVPEGGLIPQFYEISYRCWDRVGCICYPIPLNWIVRWARMFKLWMRPNIGCHAVDEVGLSEYLLMKEWNRGYKAGNDDGYRGGFKDGLQFRESTNCIGHCHPKLMSVPDKDLDEPESPVCDECGGNHPTRKCPARWADREDEDR